MFGRISFVIGICLLANISHAFGERVRYDNYRLYRVVPSDLTKLEALKSSQTHSDSLIYLQELAIPGRNIGVVVAPHKMHDFEEMLRIHEIEYGIEENNFQKILDEEIAENQFTAEDYGNYNWTRYYTLTETYNWIIDLCYDYPSVVLPLDVGVTYERRRILGFKISLDKGKTKKPGILLEGGIHAREWISPATVTYIAMQLLMSKDPAVKAIAEKYDWYIIPHANPDGYEYTHTSNRLWRKTRSHITGNCFGTDPNRNWDFHWGEAGVSDDPCAETFAGTHAFSDIETLSFSRFIASLKGKIHLYVAFHSYSQLLLFPYGHTADKAPNHDDLYKVFNVSIDAIKTRYGTKYTGGNIYDAIYPASGSSMEWAYGVQDIKMAFTYELRPQNPSLTGFRLPANKILPTAEETLDSLVAMVNEVERLGYFKI